MDRFENVNLNEYLRKIMDVNTVNYKSDFDIDIEILRKAAIADDAYERDLLWYSRPSGTFCAPIRQCFQENTVDNNGFRYYAEQNAYDLIFAYNVDVVDFDEKTGAVFGNIQELDYKEYAKLVRDTSVPSDEVQVFFENGDSVRMTLEAFRSAKTEDYPPVKYFRNIPTDADALANAVNNAWIESLENSQVVKLPVHIARLRQARIQHEADRIMDCFADTRLPESTLNNRCSVALDPYFMKSASNEDLYKLKVAIPYISLQLATKKSEEGMYAVIDAEELRMERSGELFEPDNIEKKLSILDRLKNPPEQSSSHKPAPKREKGAEI